MRRGALLAVLLAACGTAEETDPSGFFTDETLPGVRYRQSALSAGGPCLGSADDCQPERFTGALAIGDVNRDGRLDLVVTRLGAHDLLFLAEGDAYVDASEAWGLDAVSAHSNGAALVDVDRDGDLDLYVVGIGPPNASAPHDRYHFWRNDGDRFVLDGEARGLAFASDAGRAGTSIAVGDYDADGWPDLHLTEWRSEESAGRPTHERLLHNLGPDEPGHFEDVTEAAGVFLGGSQCAMDGTACSAKSFASAFSDLDDDGNIDLLVAADFGRSRLFWGRGDGTFTDGTEAAGVGSEENGMGSTVGDLDGDGDLDWFVTSISDDAVRCAAEPCGWGLSGNRMYRQTTRRVFEDATDELGVREGGWGWGAAFFDFDNDGDLDLTMTNGYDESGVDSDAPFHRDPMRLWMRARSGELREVAAEAGVTADGPGRGLCVEDLDADGDLDLLVVEHGGGLRLFRNRRGNERHWVRLRVQYEDGTTAHGARVTLGAQVREVSTAAHFLCSTEPMVHFGLEGEGGPVAVRVRWPDGTIRSYDGLSVDGTHVLGPEPGR